MERLSLDQFADLVELAAQLEQRQISPIEVTEAALARIDRTNDDFRIYVTVLAEQALDAAREAEREIMRGEYRGPLHGVPVSVKDLFATQGIRTTSGSRVMANHIPQHDAAVVERLHAAGAILIGKANMKEFACAPCHPDYGATPNPWHRGRTASGSSGGSAAAVVIGTDFGSIGTDTGGSIRVPASFCGAVGMKPSFGLISRFGMEFVSPTLDHPGPIARSVRDVAVLLDALAGEDLRDPSTVAPPVPSFAGSLHDDLVSDGTLVVGLVTELMSGVEDDVREAAQAAADQIAATGATVREVSIPALGEIEEVLTAHRTIVSAELSVVHRQRLATAGDLYSPTLRQRLQEGAAILAQDYLVALERRAWLQWQVAAAMEDVDLLILPTVYGVATPHEPATLTVPPKQADQSAVMIRTAPFNLTGQPAMTLPCGFSAEGLPIGLEIVGRPRRDVDVLRLGHAYQRVTDWHLNRPPLRVDEQPSNAMRTSAN
jgi:aspartyl-tRNA(Asn)/glutamyl-tRNA(Gln) amidotransferase subunit A